MAADSPGNWDVAAATRTCSIQPWSGMAWRCHSRKYAGDDASGSLRATGRFNRGSDKHANHETWPALYTALAEHVALGERLRHTTPESLSLLAHQRLSRLQVQLEAVLVLCAPTGCSDMGIEGVEFSDLCHPTEYATCHQIAMYARSFAEAMLVPSCTLFPDGNLIIFPDLLRSSSTIVVEYAHDPDLFIDWRTVAAEARL